MRQIVKLTDGDLHRIIRNCVNEELKYIKSTDDGGYEMVGKFAGDSDWTTFRYSGAYCDAITDMCDLVENFAEEFKNKYEHYSKNLPSDEAGTFKDFVNENGNGFYQGETALENVYNLSRWFNNIRTQVDDPADFYSL